MGVHFVQRLCGCVGLVSRMTLWSFDCLPKKRTFLFLFHVKFFFMPGLWSLSGLEEGEVGGGGGGGGGGVHETLLSTS